MGQVLHGSAATTEAVRRAIQHSQESLGALAKRYGVNPKTVAKWRKRSSVADLRTGPKEPRSTVLTVEEEAVVGAFRRHTLRPIDDCFYALKPTIPHLTRSSLHRCLKRHGISRLPQVEGEASLKSKFKVYPIGYFHIDIAEVRTAQGRLHLIVAIDRTSKFAFVELHEKVTRKTAADFLRRLIEGSPIGSTPSSPTTGPLHRSSRRNLVPSRDQGDDRQAAALPRARLRIRLRPQRYRSPADQAQASLDH